MTYLVLAISWWSVLLFRKNEAFFQAEAQLLQLQYVEAEGVEEALAALDAKHRRQRAMIIGEGLFLTLSLLAGIYLINKAYRKEVRIARQQQNFLLSITHELRSPVSAIRLSLETLQRNDLPDEKKARVIRGALNEDERLGSLIEKLLMAARMDDNPGLLNTAIPLQAWLQDLITRFREKCPGHIFRIQLPAEDLTLVADQEALHSILTNVLENAVKYGGSQAEIDVLTAVRQGGVAFSVQDRGPGIPDEEKKAIFEKFYRIGSEQTRSSKGTGLGLYIAKRLVDAHGGRIWVSDRAGGGTIFHIWLPLQKQPKT